MRYSETFGDHLAEDGSLVRDNFARWFGESRFVDAAGAPLVLFHGTSDTFETFRPSRTGAEGPGIYLASDPNMAADYGDQVMHLYASVCNPFLFYPSDESIDAEVNGELLEQVLSADICERVLTRLARDGAEGYGTEVMDELVSRGHDGILVVHPAHFGTSQLAGLPRDLVLIAFDPKQIKSADNAGLFDANSPNAFGRCAERLTERKRA